MSLCHWRSQGASSSRPASSGAQAFGGPAVCFLALDIPSGDGAGAGELVVAGPEDGQARVRVAGAVRGRRRSVPSARRDRRAGARNPATGSRRSCISAARECRRSPPACAASLLGDSRRVDLLLARLSSKRRPACGPRRRSGFFVLAWIDGLPLLCARRSAWAGTCCAGRHLGVDRVLGALLFPCRAPSPARLRRPVSRVTQGGEERHGFALRRVPPRAHRDRRRAAGVEFGDGEKSASRRAASASATVETMRGSSGRPEARRLRAGRAASRAGPRAPCPPRVACDQRRLYSGRSIRPMVGSDSISAMRRSTTAR